MTLLYKFIKSSTLALLGLSLTALSTITLASGQEDISAVQERIYDRHHEISVSGGITPNTAFFVNYPISVSYTYHLNEWLGWELVRGSYYLNKSRALTQSLIDDYKVEPGEFDFPVYSLQSALVIKPTYGKDSWFNKGVIHHQTYFTFGGGVTGYQKEFTYGDPVGDLAVSARAGVARKYFISQNLAVSLELENHFAFKKDETEHYLQLNAGIDIRFNLTEDNKDTQSFDSLYKFLERK